MVYCDCCEMEHKYEYDDNCEWNEAIKKKDEVIAFLSGRVADLEKRLALCESE